MSYPLVCPMLSSLWNAPFHAAQFAFLTRKETIVVGYWHCGSTCKAAIDWETTFSTIQNRLSRHAKMLSLVKKNVNMVSIKYKSIKKFSFPWESLPADRTWKDIKETAQYALSLGLSDVPLVCVFL